jgi:hypothetical protein
VGEGSYWRVRSFTYNDISCQGYFAKILRETAEIAGFYAGFSPVLPDSLGKNLQRVVVRYTLHNYLLCFLFPLASFCDSAHFHRLQYAGELVCGL